MSRAQQRINNFDLDLTIFPELQQKILDLAEIINNILTILPEDKQYLRELLNQLSITYNVIRITEEDKSKFESSSLSSLSNSSQFRN
jgi:protein associated with RNAse G/E